jgi:hypothetical protein
LLAGNVVNNLYVVLFITLTASKLLSYTMNKLCSKQIQFRLHIYIEYTRKVTFKFNG